MTGWSSSGRCSSPPLVLPRSVFPFPSRSLLPFMFLYQQEGVNGQFTLLPEGALASPPNPLFLDGGPVPSRVAGTVAGQGLPTLGNITIGFDYLRPFWSFRDFTLAVPGRAAGSFPL